MLNPAAPLHGGDAVSLAAATVLDATALAGLRGLDPTGVNRLLERVVKAFQGSLDRLLPQLLDAQANGDTAGIRHVAHTLKSSSASIGAMRLSGLCAELETAVRSGALDGLRERIEALCAEVERVKPALEQLSPGMG
jgi:HPt (histidine-containing phosphotransfer) domain-containing protein